MGTLKDAILSVDDRKKEQVEIEEWGQTVEVRSLSGKERAQIMRMTVDKKGDVDTEKLYSVLLIKTLYDPESGELIFSDDDAPALLDKNAAVLKKLGRVAFQLSGFGEQALVNAEKN